MLHQSIGILCQKRILVIEGRRPNNANEIALSKQYFENNPSVKIGDKLYPNRR